MKRDKYVDIVKGICIILVVYVHLNIITNNFNMVNNYIQIFIYQFFLSVFFIVSGFYLKNMDKPKEFINTKVKKWYIKLILYYIPFVLLHNVFIKLGIYEIGKVYGDKITAVYSIKTMIIKIIETVLLMGREPLLGALWFFITLIIAMLGLTIICYIVNIINKKYNFNKEKVIFTILILLMLISTTLTQIFSFTIPRISIAMTAMILIYIGFYFNQIINLKYNNKFILFVSIITLICNTLYVDRLRMNKNIIMNPVTFLTSAIAGLYLLCFIGKRIEKNRIGKLLEICGKYSFSIMAFHLISFKVAILIINNLKIENITVISDLEPLTSNIIGIIIYMLIGTSIPILIAKIIEFIKTKSKKIRG